VLFRVTHRLDLRGDLLLLTGAMRWATTMEENGVPLLSRNPLAEVTLPTVRDPRRPIVSDEDIAKLEAVAPEVDPQLPLLIKVAKHTGRRLSSYLKLRIAAIDFERRLDRLER
jgi:integrase